MGNAPTVNASTNLVRTLIAQNNLAQEQEYCATFNFICEQCTCHGMGPFQKLTTQEKTLGQQYDSNRPTTRFQFQQLRDYTFMNYQPRDYFHVNHDGNDGIAYNTRSKRKVVETISSSLTNQASTLSSIP